GLTIVSQEPLAARMRPRTFEDFVGQAHLVGPGKALSKLVETGNLTSTILWGPAGTGKTTLAYLLADAVGAHLIQLSAVSSGVAGGDARIALTGLEAAALAASAGGDAEITRDLAADAVQHKAVVYDRQGDAHYDVISAFIKSIRGSDPDAALFWLARMLEAGEDARYIARRMVVHASEDIGLADPRALLVATAAAQAVEYVGLPECRLNLAEAAIYLARAPKSNSVVSSLGKATEDAVSGDPV